MSFRDMVENDNHAVFSNLAEFADLHTVIYDGETYEDVPCVISKLKSQDRVISTEDHAQGLYLVTAVVHFPLSSLGNVIPEKGGKIRISDSTGFFRDYYVAQSACDLGMVRIELEAIDE